VGGFGREVMPVLQQQVRAAGEAEAEFVFVDDGVTGESMNDLPLMDFDTFCELPADDHRITVPIAAGKTRETLTEKCEQAGLSLVEVRAANTVVLSEVELGEGAILCPFSMITSNVRIGKSFHANLYSYVAHDCVIGDYVTFAPRVHCNGNVRVQDQVYIGTGAIIKQGKPGRPLTIGEGATISAGAFVTKNVPPGMTVFGNPAVEMTKENLRRRNG